MQRRPIVKLVITDSVASNSPAIDLIDADGIEIDAELLELPRGVEVNVRAERSDDRENWEPLTGNLAMSNFGHYVGTWSSIGARYVRFKLTRGPWSGTAVAIFGVAATKS